MTRVPPRVLVAEGEPPHPDDDRRYAEGLKEAGYEVLATPSGSEALEFLDDPGDVDLVVTAIMLSGADGIEIARSARTHGEAVPVVFASGHSSRLASARSRAHTAVWPALQCGSAASRG